MAQRNQDRYMSKAKRLVAEAMFQSHEFKYTYPIATSDWVDGNNNTLSRTVTLAARGHGRRETTTVLFTVEFHRSIPIGERSFVTALEDSNEICA